MAKKEIGSERPQWLIQTPLSEDGTYELAMYVDCCSEQLIDISREEFEFLKIALAKRRTYQPSEAESDVANHTLAALGLAINLIMNLVQEPGGAIVAEDISKRLLKACCATENEATGKGESGAPAIQ